MDESELLEIIKQARAEWRGVRNLRLELRDSLISGGMTRQELRKERAYRELKKKQQHLSRIIRHLEKKYNRKRSAADNS